MSRHRVRVHANGQITLPAEVRPRRLSAAEGGRAIREFLAIGLRLADNTELAVAAYHLPSGCRASPTTTPSTSLSQSGTTSASLPPTAAASTVCSVCPVWSGRRAAHRRY